MLAHNVACSVFDFFLQMWLYFGLASDFNVACARGEFLAASPTLSEGLCARGVQCVRRFIFIFDVYRGTCGCVSGSQAVVSERSRRQVSAWRAVFSAWLYFGLASEFDIDVVRGVACARGVCKPDVF